MLHLPMAKKRRHKPRPRPQPKPQQAKQETKARTKPENPERKKQVRLLGLIVGVLGAVLYLNTVNHNFVLDDFSVIKRNWVVQEGTDGIGTILKTHYRYGYWNSEGSLYRPLSLVMFAIEWDWFGPDGTERTGEEIAAKEETVAHVMHWMNVLLYFLLGFVLFQVLSRLMADLNPAFPFVTALLFMVHPIHTEVVANIKSRDEILSLLFCLLALGLMLRYLSTEKMKHLALALVSYFLAFVSKEGAITFLLIFPLAIYFFTSTPLKKNIRLSAFFLLPTVVYLLIRQSVLGEVAELTPGVVDNMLVNADLVTRWATAILILGKYLLLLVFPHPLVSDYSYNEIPLTGFGDVWALLSLAIYGGLLLFAIMQLKKKNIIAFGILVYLITIALPSNLFFLIGTNMGERLLFVPSLGFALVMGYLGTKLLGGGIEGGGSWQLNAMLQRNKTLFAIAGLIIVAYAWKTWTRNYEWESDYTLYAADVQKSTNSARSHYHYALQLQQEKALKTDIPSEKEQFLDMAITEFGKAVEIYPSYSDAWDQMGIAYLRKNDNENAIRCFNKALDISPNKPETWSNMGKIYFDAATSYQQQMNTAGSEEEKQRFKRLAIEQFGKAEEVYRKAVTNNPRYSDGWRNLGSVYAMTMRFQESQQAYEECLKYAPKKPAMVYQFMGMNYQNMGQPQKAQEYLNKAYQLDPSLKK